MRLQFQRPVEVRRGDELAEVRIAEFVLSKQRQPVDAALAADLGWPRHRKHRADDRLNALGEASVAERHHAVKPVAIGDRDRRKAKLR